ncbi:PREDICTED: elicitor-responsive protein 1-like [Nelumbo nucifera]|uniref:Elicitor-responsive protein 1-like n=2 Tax=Nelumbo nucifera TaxID=4432 RepID=A0A1U8AP99_NELNU|nr:PREDICTED: elicitor-responsive protein 1-like [Nelumbo nucifera]DAD28208.1 TPA_asm: hypothetical protein HUJ06_029676 [Nelumbo nucifera]
MASGILQVLLVDAHCMQNKDLFAKMDPYVVIKYGKEERKSSVARRQGRNPVWNEKFTFKAEYPGKVVGPHKLTLTVMDKDTFTADDFVGESTIYIKDVLSLGIDVGKAELPPRKYRLVLADKTYEGEIRVGVSFTKKVEDENYEGQGGWKQSSL